MRLGSLPPAVDPNKPTETETEATKAKLAQYQDVFNTH
jgi:L-asparaginase